MKPVKHWEAENKEEEHNNAQAKKWQLLVVPCFSTYMKLFGELLRPDLTLKGTA